jgi:hypothetical protein
MASRTNKRGEKCRIEFLKDHQEWLFFPMGRSIKDPHTPEKVGNDHYFLLQIS